MKRKIPDRVTRSEQQYVRDMNAKSALDLLETGKARVLRADEYPPPLKRFLERERRMVHVTLSLAIKRRLEARNRRTGKPIEELARLWIEQGLKRQVG